MSALAESSGDANQDMRATAKITRAKRKDRPGCRPRETRQENWCATELTHGKINKLNPPALTAFSAGYKILSRANPRTRTRLCSTE
jgi:hypothetical protein